MSSLKKLLLIEREEVEKYLTFMELFQALEKAFINFSKGPKGGVVQPVRSVVSVEKHKGFLGSMPAYSTYDDALATKLVAFYPNNEKFGLPTHLANVLLFDSKTGTLQAIIDGESVTEIRTAVASAVATKHLANPDSRILAIIGAGVQGRSHFKALSQIYKFDEVRVWSRTKKSAEKFAADFGAKACDSVEETTNNADIICTCTHSQKPILLDKHVKPGAHINGVGACRPDWHELEPELVRNAVVISDSTEACMKESGDVLISKAEIYAELGEILSGEKSCPAGKITFFNSMGMAIEDVVSAKIVYEKYTSANK